MKTIQAADLFCGAGGTSSGLLRAAEGLGLAVNLLAVNHWPAAIATHTLNHPEARHLCESLSNIRPQEVVPGGELDILTGSPECTHHSRAKGGKPRCPQSRAGAYHIVDWCSQLRVKNVLVENVPEFAEWGPLSKAGKPIRSKRGLYFRAWLQTMQNMGYKIATKVVNCADYGDPTTRTRLFVLASLERQPEFPAITHPMDKWIPARSIIDWGFKTKSVFNRSRPLANRTIYRIKSGLVEFDGRAFLIKYYGSEKGGSSLDLPIATITCKDRFALCIPVFDGAAAGRWDVRLRMLQPSELARGQGFSKFHMFAGRREEIVKQIGNAVPVNTAAALCRSLLQH